MLLEDLFDVKNIDEDGKKFDNISRISALSQTYNLELTLDINTEIYPVKVGPCTCLSPAASAPVPPHHDLRALVLCCADGRALLAGSVHQLAEGRRAGRWRL